MSNAINKYGQVEFGGALSPCFGHIQPVLADKKVLDIASGDGTYLRHFGKGSMGIDISDVNIDICKKQNLLSLKADLNTFFPIKKESFDAVFCSNILEHVDSPIFMLRESHRILKSNGIFVLCVPNEDSLIHLIYDYYEANGRHLYSFSMNNINALMRETGFAIEQFFGDFHTVQTRKYHMTPLLEMLHKFPLTLVNKMSHFYWVVARKGNLNKKP